jgi:hypothetical protein
MGLHIHNSKYGTVPVYMFIKKITIPVVNLSYVARRADSEY